MKLTESMLRNIIKEELTTILQEAWIDDGRNGEWVPQPGEEQPKGRWISDGRNGTWVSQEEADEIDATRARMKANWPAERRKAIARNKKWKEEAEKARAMYAANQAAKK
jgi:hypothetical protein